MHSYFNLYLYPDSWGEDGELFKLRDILSFPSTQFKVGCLRILILMRILDMHWNKMDLDHENFLKIFGIIFLIFSVFFLLFSFFSFFFMLKLDALFRDKENE